MPLLPADFSHARACKPICEKSLTLPQEQDGKPELPVISALFKFVPSRFTPHLHQNQPHGALTKAPGRAGTAGQTWGFLVVYVKLTCGACNLHDFS